MTNSPPFFEMVATGIIIKSERCRGEISIKLMILIDYRMQKECNLQKCQKDLMKGIQITKANLVVNVVFGEGIKFSVREASKYRQMSVSTKH